VSVTDVNVFPEHGKGTNHLRTFFSKRKFDLSLGLAFKINETESGERPDYLKVCATHLDHEEFSYEIHLVCSESSDTMKEYETTEVLYIIQSSVSNVCRRDCRVPKVTVTQPQSVSSSLQDTVFMESDLQWMSRGSYSFTWTCSK
jgi:hypothetical protein